MRFADANHYIDSISLLFPLLFARLQVVMLPSDNEGYPMAMVEQRTAVWNGCFDGNPIEPFDEICNRQPTLSFQLNWSKTPGCFREKDVIKPPQSNGPLFSSSSSTSSKMKVLDAIGVRTDTLSKLRMQSSRFRLHASTLVVYDSYFTALS